MASTYSPNLRLELIGTGEQQGTWGATTNTNLGTLIEEAIGGYVSVTVSDVGDTTLTTNNGAADQARNAVINLTGTISAARNVICPAIEKVYIVRNATTGGFAVTFKVSGQTGVSIPNGSTYLLYVNGTDAVAVTGSMAAQLANNVAITGGTISNATLSNVAVVANASSLGVRDSDGSHVLSIAAGSNLTANRVFTLTTGDAARTLDISAGNVTISTAGSNLIDDADASAQRTTLGLGTIATQNANNVTITGGSVSGITDLALADGGTGASLSDPGADAILGWNDTANVVRFFTAGTGISINATSNTISSTASTTGSLLRAPQVLTSGTSYTTPAGCTGIYVELVGGGGGGGGADSASSTNTMGSAGGGGSGAYAAKYFTVTPSTSYSYAIGGAGTAGANTGGNGGAGGNTTFTVGGTTVTAGGGGGGNGVLPPSGDESRIGIGGAGGTPTNGDLNATGSAGAAGQAVRSTAGGTDDAIAGAGGSSFFGGGGQAAERLNNSDGSSAGSNGSSGGGGGGAALIRTTTGAAGGAGGAGLIRIWEFS